MKAEIKSIKRRQLEAIVFTPADFRIMMFRRMNTEIVPKEFLNLLYIEPTFSQPELALSQKKKKETIGRSA